MKGWWFGSRSHKGVLCTAKKRGEEARGFTTVRGAPQNGDGRFRDHAPDRSAALQNLYFFKRGAKNFRKRGKCTKKKERPEIAWFTVTMRRATGRRVGTGRIRAADRPKNFNRFESHTQHLSNEDESGRLQPDL